jgi:broad specificity phosphatase PhoE
VIWPAARPGVVFTSGGVIAAVAAALLEVPDEALVALNRVAVNGAVTKVVGGRRGTTLLSFNEHAHQDAGGLVTFR